MAVYIYDERQIESIIRATKRFRLRYCAAAVTVLIASVVVALSRPQWIFGADSHARVWVMAALFVFFAGPLGENLWRWRSRPVKLEECLRRMKVEISEEGVTVAGASSTRSLSWSEIQRAEEVPWGLYLRSANRYRWLHIPAKIEHFAALKQEICQARMPIVEAAAPPNWEEFAGVLIFAATMFCAIFAHSTRVLAANLLISALVAFCGFLVISANPDNLPKMRWARFGIFLPVLMTASMLWLAVRG